MPSRSFLDECASVSTVWIPASVSFFTSAEEMPFWPCDAAIGDQSEAASRGTSAMVERAARRRCAPPASRWACLTRSFPRPCRHLRPRPPAGTPPPSSRAGRRGRTRPAVCERGTNDPRSSVNARAGGRNAKRARGAALTCGFSESTRSIVQATRSRSELPGRERKELRGRRLLGRRYRLQVAQRSRPQNFSYRMKRAYCPLLRTCDPGAVSLIEIV